MTCRARALCCAIAVVTLLLNLSTAARAAADRGFATVGGNVKPTTDVDMGAFTNPHMSVVVVLAPRDASGLSSLLADLYNTNNKNQHWLAKGEFYSRFAPDPARAAAVADYLRESGLDVEQTSSPFLLRVSSSRDHGGRAAREASVSAPDWSPRAIRRSRPCPPGDVTEFGRQREQRVAGHAGQQRAGERGRDDPRARARPVHKVQEPCRPSFSHLTASSHQPRRPCATAPGQGRRPSCPRTWPRRYRRGPRHVYSVDSHTLTGFTPLLK